MYAVFRYGSHQFRAEAGDSLDIEHREAAPGDEIVFDQVLMVGGEKAAVGSPTVPGAKVVAVVEGECKGARVRGMRKRENNNSQTRFGHRQKYTTVTIRKIVTK
ncbi:MAG: 50S ribosomal protein L21 [Planctomycetota bacterium]|jgi:large subunit ribosomal protein L21